MTHPLTSAWWPQASSMQPEEAVWAAVEAMEANVPVPRLAARHVASALRAYLDGKSSDLARSLGLKARRGGRYDKPAQRQKLQRRNDLLARLYAAQAGTHGKQRAKALLALLSAPAPAETVQGSELAEVRAQLLREFAGQLPRSWEQVHRLVKGSG